MPEIPYTQIGFMNGLGIQAARFLAACLDEAVTVLKDSLVLETPMAGSTGLLDVWRLHNVPARLTPNPRETGEIRLQK